MQCVFCLYEGKGKREPATVTVAGYSLCEEHGSRFMTDVFLRGYTEAQIIKEAVEGTY